MGKLPDLQVVIPYRTLLELLDAAQSVSELKKTIELRDQQIHAMRGQLSEVFEVIGEIRRELRSYQD